MLGRRETLSMKLYPSKEQQVRLSLSLYRLLSSLN